MVSGRNPNVRVLPKSRKAGRRERIRPPMVIHGATEMEVLRARIVSMRQLLYAFMLERDDPSETVVWTKEDLVTLNPEELRVEVIGPNVRVRLEQGGYNPPTEPLPKPQPEAAGLRLQLEQPEVDPEADTLPPPGQLDYPA